MAAEPITSAGDSSVAEKPLNFGERMKVRREHDMLAGVVGQFKNKKPPKQLRLACEAAGITIEWVLKQLVSLMEGGELNPSRRVDLLELANWWLMVSYGVKKEHRKIRPLRPRKYIQPGDRDTRTQKVIEGVERSTEKIEQLEAGEEKIENRGGIPGVSPFPGGIVPDQGPGRRARMKNRYVVEKLGAGFLDKVGAADNG